MSASASHGPGYWMNETGDLLRPAIERYLNAAELDERDIDVIRAYCRQWIMAPVWDENPHHKPGDSLDELRIAVAWMFSRREIDAWIKLAQDEGLDPL